LQKRFDSYWLIYVVMVTFLARRPANAQTASVGGSVVDVSGAAIDGALVTAQSSAGNVVERTLTDSLGMFMIRGILPGKHLLTIEKERFETARIEIEILEGGAASPIRVALQIGEVRQSVTVEAQPSYVVSTATTATKTDTSLMETPVTIQVMPQQILNDMGQQQNIGKFMSYLGIPSGGFDSYVAYYYYRGFLSTGTLWNGFKIEELSTTAGPGAGPVWTDNVDRLELMRGPASILYGQVEPGGVLNVITKKPLDNFRGEALFGWGSWVDGLASLDIIGPINRSKTLLGRVFASGQLANSWFTYDPTYKSAGFAPQLEWRISPRTTLSFEGQYRTVTAATWPQSYSYAAPSTGQLVSAGVKKSRWPDNADRTDQTRSMISFNHGFNHGWSVSWKFMDDEALEPYAYYQYSNDADFSTQAPGVLIASLGLIYNNSTLKTRASTLDFLSHFSTWGIKHTVLTGVDVYSQDFSSIFGCCGPADLTTNIFNPIHAKLTDGSGESTSQTNRLRESQYVQDQIALPGNLYLLAGVRYDVIRENYSASGVPIPSYKTNVLTPRAGLLWRPREPLSVYYSYSENQGQSDGFEYPGTPLKPEFSTQHEAGVKTEWLGGRLNATADVFRLTKENIATSDPNPAHVSFVLGVGKIRSTGFELSLQGAVTGRLQLLANYNYARPLVVVGTSGVSFGNNFTPVITAGQVLPDIPTRTFSAWTSYQVPRVWGLTLGGGPTWRSKTYPDSFSYNLVTGKPVSADAYWLASAFVRYSREVTGLDTQFQLSGENLFNKLYSTTVQCYGGMDQNDCVNLYGTPRSVQLQMRVRF